MKLSLHAGPVHAPALRASGTQAAAAHVAPRRRPIGEGAREIVVSDPASVARPRRRARTRPELAARSRRRTPLFATLLCAFAASAAALGIGAAVDAPRSLMSREDFQDARRGVEAATRGALAECRTQDGVAREICRARARGDERVKMAELQARY
ncbi:MAG TPA: hypothetical protein VFP36_10845, partial [Usitatibacter sp.]|nr:hypothetical protein [Usitatibacter sp.]